MGCTWSSLLCMGFLFLQGLLSCSASLVAKHRLYGMWALVVRHSGSVLVGHGLSCSMACGIFPDRESNPCPLHWQADSYPPYHQGSPRHHPLKKLVCNISVLEIIFLVNNNNTQNERNQNKNIFPDAEKIICSQQTVENTDKKHHQEIIIVDILKPFLQGFFPVCPSI